MAGRKGETLKVIAVNFAASGDEDDRRRIAEALRILLPSNGAGDDPGATCGDVNSDEGDDHIDMDERGAQKQLAPD